MIGQTFPFYAVAKPTAPLPAVDSDQKVTCTGNFLAQKLSNALGVKIDFVACTGNLEAEKMAVQELQDVSTAWKTGLQKLRAECREMLEKANSGNCILILGDVRRYKSKQASTPAACPAENAPGRETSEDDPPLAALRELFPDDYLGGDVLNSLDAFFLERLGQKYLAAGYVAFVKRRGIKRRIETGLVLERQFLPKDFCEWVEGQRAAMPVNPEASQSEDEAEMERWRDEQRADLDNPDVSEEDKRLIRLCLGIDDPAGRKPAESESGAKARKAGQS